MKSPLVKNILMRILSGRMSKEEENEILQRKSVESTMQKQWNNPAGDVSNFNKQKIWDQLELETKNQVTVPGRNNIRRLVFWSAAASILVLIGIGIGYYNYRSASVVKELQLISAETNYQERTLVFLPDSTKVWLNAGSRIEYPERFMGDIREVKLSGEAYFDVVRNEKQAFVVSTDHLQVHVLGTRFVVTDYKNEKKAETVLVSGKVQVNTENQQFNLSPNEQLVFDPGQQTASVRDIDASQYTGWISGKLTFDDAELDDVINKLERWYGVNIKYPEELGKNYRLTFTIRDETLSQIMQLMQNMIPIKFNLSENDGYVIENNLLTK